MPSSNRLFHPDFAVKPYWWDDNPPLAIQASLPARVDVAIVGSGYCGLAAGLELVRHGLSVSFLHAGRNGEGASTCTGGMVRGGFNVPMALPSALGGARFTRLVRDMGLPLLTFVFLF